MLRYRLRWFAVATARLLLRRWQAVALIIGLGTSAATSASGNIRIMTHPLLMLLAPEHGAIWRAGYLAALLGFAALWAGMQRVQIEGGAFMAFAGSLPFGARQLRRVTLAVLLVADGPLLLLVGGALAVTIAHGDPAAHALLLGDVMLLALVTQMAVLEKRFNGLLPVALACCMMACGFDTRAALAIDLLVGMAAVAALWLVSWPGPWPAPGKPALRLPARMPGRLNRPHRRSSATGSFGPMRLSLAILLRERRNELTGKALIAGAITAVAWSLVRIFDGDARSFPTVLMAQGLVALVVSGMFRSLDLTHCASAAYTAALPLAPRWWRMFDLAAVVAFCLPFFVVLAAAAWCMGAATPVRGLAAIIAASLLLCALSVPQRYTERHAVVLGTVMTGLWIAAVIKYLP